jgi:hypothetical protein
MYVGVKSSWARITLVPVNAPLGALREWVVVRFHGGQVPCRPHDLEALVSRRGEVPCGSQLILSGT